jgi:hypothetical protein
MNIFAFLENIKCYRYRGSKGNLNTGKRVCLLLLTLACPEKLLLAFTACCHLTQNEPMHLHTPSWLKWSVEDGLINAFSNLVILRRHVRCYPDNQTRTSPLRSTRGIRERRAPAFTFLPRREMRKGERTG